MASGQVIGRHEVFEYAYKVGSAEDRKRIKLVVIQRRDQRRKSLIAAQKYLDRTPVKLRVNLHRALGEPEVVAKTPQHIPITLRRKAKAAPTTTTRVHHARPAPAEIHLHAPSHTTHTHAPTHTTIVHAPPSTTHTHAPSHTTHTQVIHKSLPSPPSEPNRIELVDRPVVVHPGHGPSTPSSITVADPDPILVIPSGTSSSDPGHESVTLAPSLSRTPSQASSNKPKVKRSNSFGSSFRRFPSIMGMLRRNSRTTTPPSSTPDFQHGYPTPPPTGGGGTYFDHNAPRSPGSHNMIIEERDSELGSPVGAPSGYGPPSVVGRKPVPSIPESAGSGRSRTWSFGRPGNSPRNKLVKPSPRHVPLPESLRDPSVRDHSVTGSPLVIGTYPHGSELGHDARSVHSRRTDRSAHDRNVRTPDYTHDGHLHESPVSHRQQLIDPYGGGVLGGSVAGGRSMVDGRSLHDGRSHDGRSGRSLHSGSNDGRSHDGRSHRDGLSHHDGLSHRGESVLHGGSVRDESIRHYPMVDGSVIGHSSAHGRSPSHHHGLIPEHHSSARSFGGMSDKSRQQSLLEDMAHRPPPTSDGYRSPSLQEGSIRNLSVREAFSDGDRENDHEHDYERSLVSPSLHAPSHRGGVHSPSLHDPSSQRGSSHRGSSHRAMSPSIRDPHSRVASPLSHRDQSVASSRAESPSMYYHREASPSVHHHREASPSIHRGASPSILAPSSHRDVSPSLHRGASPSLQAPSYREASPNPLHNGNGFAHSPPGSMHAPSVKSRAPSSVASSKVPMSSVGGRGFSRPKSPLSASGSSNTSRRTRGPLGPDITPVPMPGHGSAAPSMHAPSTHAPSMRAPSTHAPSTASHRTGASKSIARSPLGSQFPMGEAPPAPSIAGSHRSGRVSEAAYGVPLPESAPPSEIGTSVFGTSVYGSAYRSAAGHSRAPSTVGGNISRGPSAAAISRAPSAAPISRAPSAAAFSTAPSAARVPLPESAPPSEIGTVYARSTAGRHSRTPSAAGISRAPSAATVQRAPSAAGIIRAPSAAGGRVYAPTAVAPSVAGSMYAPSAAGTARAPSAAGTHRQRSPSVSGIPRAPSAAGTYRAPSAAGTHRAPSAAAIQRAPSAAGTHRAPSASITRAPSAAGTHRGPPPSVAASQRIPPSVIGSQRVPPSIAGSAPSGTSPPSQRHTPPPESGVGPAPSDIAPESESHGGAALRAQARLEGDKMAMAFEASQVAYREGDGERAKELANMGRAHQTKMQELHAEAAEQVFREKNEGREPGEIDLHGLYVKEAVSRLSQFIREAPALGQTNLRVITGKGLHSEGDPQIMPAVEESLRKKGLRHHTDEANAGVIVVELGPRSPVSE